MSFEEEPSQGNAHSFPLAPAGWYYFCPLVEIENGPKSQVVGDRLIVVFHTQSGKVAALSGRCCHLSADLGEGSVEGETLRCGLHGWQYGVDGLCKRIPCSQDIPGFAKQTVYPTALVCGHVFVFNRPNATYAMPFFDGKQPHELLAASAYGMTLQSPWYMVACNSFDVQHFACAHDRTMVGEVRVDDLGRYARRISVDFAVTGRSLRDRVTRAVSGERLTMSITMWGGLLMFVHAKFRRTTTYGMLCLVPDGSVQTRAVNIVMVARGESLLQSAVAPLSVRIRKSFIRAFLQADLRLLRGLRYTPASLLPEDRVMKDFFDWLGPATTSGTKAQTGPSKEMQCEREP